MQNVSENMCDLTVLYYTDGPVPENLGPEKGSFHYNAVESLQELKNSMRNFQPILYNLLFNDFLSRLSTIF